MNRHDPAPAPPPALPDWWGDAFARLPYQTNPPGADEMLIVVAYDVADAKRLAKTAQVCEDYGRRVQYSIFECHLDQEAFNELWLKLLEIVDEDEDRLVAYKLDARCAREIETAGTMVCSEKSVCYLI